MGCTICLSITVCMGACVYVCVVLWGQKLLCHGCNTLMNGDDAFFYISTEKYFYMFNLERHFLTSRIKTIQIWGTFLIHNCVRIWAE